MCVYALELSLSITWPYRPNFLCLFQTQAYSNHPYQGSVSSVCWQSAGPQTQLTTLCLLVFFSSPLLFFSPSFSSSKVPFITSYCWHCLSHWAQPVTVSHCNSTSHWLHWLAADSNGEEGRAPVEKMRSQKTTNLTCSLLCHTIHSE